MNSEDYFKSNLQKFRKKMVELQSKYPSLSSAIDLDRDPHIEHMIDAFAFIASEVQYKHNNKINRETKSIVRNFYSSQFHPSPPMGILKLISHEKTFVKKNSILNCSGAIFRSINEYYISSIEIQEIKKEEGFIKISFNKPSHDIDKIDLYCEPTLLNKIFLYKNKIEIFVVNREQYKTSAKCILKSEMILKNYIHFPKSQCFISLEELQLKATGDIFSVLIPCEELNSNSLDVNSFETNCILIENRYTNYTSPLSVKEETYYPLLLENNDQLITIKKVLDNNKNEIPHISQDQNGWYLMKNESNYVLYLGVNKEVIYCEIECFNNFLNNELPPFFEEFIPGKLKWFSKPCEAKKYDSSDEITQIIKLAHEEVSLEKYIYSLINFVNLEDYKINVFKIKIIESVKPMFVGNYVISQVGKVVDIYCYTQDYILLKCLAKSIQDKYETFVDITFHVNNKKIFFEKPFLKQLEIF